MAVPSHRFSRRSLLAATVLASRALADGTSAGKGEAFESAWRRYTDPATELDVYRLTEPSDSSTLPMFSNRVISRNSGLLLYCCDRGGSPQAFRMDLKTGATRRLTDRAELDGSSLNWTPDSRAFAYFAGRTLYLGNLATLKEREVYTIPEGWERSAGLTITADGAHALCAEHRGDAGRIRLTELARGAARTVVETPSAVVSSLERPLRSQILYRDAAQGVWLVDSDGRHNRRLKLAGGGIGPLNWAADGRTLLYLNFPEDPRQLTAIREHTPDDESDKLVAPTSQYAHFGFNRDTSVFVGASRNKASPVILILLRVTRRELTLCEHKATHPETVAPMFSPDAQRIYFQSDRDGKPALYALHVEKLVEKIETEKE